MDKNKSTKNSENYFFIDAKGKLNKDKIENLEDKSNINENYHKNCLKSADAEKMEIIKKRMNEKYYDRTDILEQTARNILKSFRYSKI